MSPQVDSRCSNFTFMWLCIVTNFLIIKPTRCTNFSNLFWNETLHISDSSAVHHQELFTVQSAMVYVIQVSRQPSSRIRMEFHPDPAAARKLSTKLVWLIPLLSVQWITPDDGQQRDQDGIPSWSCCCSKAVYKTCMTYTIAECTVNNSWWWTAELSETCRVSFQNKFEKLVHLVGFIIRKADVQS
jgi:hypothetical protein